MPEAARIGRFEKCDKPVPRKMVAGKRAVPHSVYPEMERSLR